MKTCKKQKIYLGKGIQIRWINKILIFLMVGSGFASIRNQISKQNKGT